VHEPHHHASSHGKRRPPPALHRPQCDLCRRTEINLTGLDSNGPDDESITLALSDRGYCHEQLLALTPRGGVRKWSTVPISLSYTTPRGERAASERHTKSRRLRLPLPSHYPSIMLQTYRTRYRDEKRCELDEGFSGGDEAHAAVSPRRPLSPGSYPGPRGTRTTPHFGRSPSSEEHFLWPPCPTLTGSASHSLRAPAWPGLGLGLGCPTLTLTLTLWAP
jgi:hypothetical protein